MVQRCRNALITCARFNGASPIHVERSVMKVLLATLLAGMAISAYAAVPLTSLTAFSPDSQPPLQSEEDKDKDKDEKKKDG
jgi:hypothetical protein